MTGNEFQVEPGVLDAHAGVLDGLADDMTKAVEAADAATLHGEAYGKICAFFVPVIQYISEPCRTQLSEAADTLEQDSGKLRDTARGYQDVDAGNATSLRVEGW
jgi:hypothetical protein